jgi:hypothetical protein
MENSQEYTDRRDKAQAKKRMYPLQTSRNIDIAISVRPTLSGIYERCLSVDVLYRSIRGTHEASSVRGHSKNDKVIMLEKV